MFEYMFLPFKRYAEFSGRSRRMEYWSFTLLNLAIMMVLMLLALAAGFSVNAFAGDPATAVANLGAGFWIVITVLVIYWLFALIPGIAVVIRRLHDRDMSGWWYLGFIVASMIPFVSFIAGIALLVITLLPGTPGPNRFGEDPKDPMSAQVFA